MPKLLEQPQQTESLTTVLGKREEGGWRRGGKSGRTELLSQGQGSFSCSPSHFLLSLNRDREEEG